MKKKTKETDYTDAGRARAAAQRETTRNAAAMREALERATRMLSAWRRDMPYRAWSEIDETIDKCNTALSAPPRNCDVGTAEEQVERYNKFRFSRKCDECPVYLVGESVDCGVRWAQRPYEKGENDEGQ